MALKGKASWLTCEVCSTAIGLIRLYPSVYTTQTVSNILHFIICKILPTPHIINKLFTQFKAVKIIITNWFALFSQIKIFVEMCSTLGYEERKVCSGIADLFGEEFVYILSHSNLTHSEICGLVISPSCSADENYPNDPKWTIPLAPMNTSLEKALASHRTMDRLMAARAMKPSGNLSTILHLSDIHLDLYYQVNAYASCSEPLCCRTGSSQTSKSQPAGLNLLETTKKQSSLIDLLLLFQLRLLGQFR